MRTAALVSVENQSLMSTSMVDFVNEAVIFGECVETPLPGSQGREAFSTADLDCTKIQAFGVLSDDAVNPIRVQGEDRKVS